jgi:hypothetical protein
MVAPNPYQSPISTADEPRLAFDEPHSDWILKPGARARLLTTVVILGGSEFVVFVLALGILAYSIVESGALLMTSGGPTLLTAMGFFSLVKTFALPIWAFMPGPQRRFSLVAALLHPIAVTAVSIFCLRIMRGGYMPGMMELFGASAFALLMTSQSLLALAARTIAVSQKLRFLRAICGLAVIGYALSAAACSMNVLEVLPLYNNPLVLISMGTGMLGQLMQILVFFNLFNWARRIGFASPDANENRIDQ